MELSIHDKMKRHVGLPVSFKLSDNKGGEDEFYFVPLDSPDIITMLAVSTEVQEKKVMSKEQTLDILGLIKKMVKKSYPELSDDEIEGFVSYHLIELLQILYAIHGWAEKASPVKDRLEELKEQRKKK